MTVRAALGVGLVAVPNVIVVAGFALSSGCEYDCWDQGVGLWLVAALLTFPLCVVGAGLLTAPRARKLAVVVATVAVYLVFGGAYFVA